jgi:hypothetical protein
VYGIVVLTLLAAADAEQTVKVQASAPWTYAKADVNAKAPDAKQLVIKSADDLGKNVPDAKKAAESLAKSLKVKSINWDKQMLIVVTAGTKRTGGFKVEVTDVKTKGDVLTVSYKVTPPSGVATQAFTHPGTVVLVPQHKGKVVFEQAKK